MRNETKKNEKWKHKNGKAKSEECKVKENDLRRLSRQELIQIIYEMKKNEIKLRSELEAAQQKLEEREIKLADVGSIAEAALQLNGVFEAAQEAADEYLRSIHNLYKNEYEDKNENVDTILRENIDELLKDIDIRQDT